MDLTLFQTINALRASEVPKFNDVWSIQLWSLAICGEAGELANLCKKVQRGDLTLEEAQIDILKEIADVMSYRVSAINSFGLYDASKVLATKFDEVSDRVGWNGPRLLEMDIWGK